MADKQIRPDVNVSFDLGKINIEDLFEIERLLAKNGITFDTGSGFGKRDWQWDWSLEGPIEVIVNIKSE